MKRLMLLALAGVFSIALTGCGDNNAPKSPTTDDAATMQQPAAQPQEAAPAPAAQTETPASEGTESQPAQ